MSKPYCTVTLTCRKCEQRYNAAVTGLEINKAGDLEVTDCEPGDESCGCDSPDSWDMVEVTDAVYDQENTYELKRDLREDARDAADDMEMRFRRDV